MITSRVNNIASLLVDKAKVQISYETASTREKSIQLGSSTSTLTISQLKKNSEDSSTGIIEHLFERVVLSTAK